MQAVQLLCHPSTPCDYVRQIDVRVDMLSHERIVFYYRIEGDIDRLRLPPPRRSARADGLWKNTCFEAFLRVPGERSYFELNFSPSSEWAVYRFNAYREGGQAIEAAPAPKIVCRRREDSLEADIDVSVTSLQLPAKARGGLQLAVSAVLQDQREQISYWALAHPPGKPDFHHPDSFVLQLTPGAGVRE